MRLFSVSFPSPPKHKKWISLTWLGFMTWHGNHHWVCHFPLFQCLAHHGVSCLPCIACYCYNLRFRFMLQCSSVTCLFSLITPCPSQVQKSEPHTIKESRAQKKHRIRSSLCHKTRKLSGWNIFQRERLQKSQMEPARYTSCIKTLGKEWAAMSKEEKEAYNIQAQFEDLAKDNIKDQPLPAKGQSLSAQEQLVGKNSRKKMSVQRLLHNYSQAESHPAWTNLQQMGDRCLSKLELVPSSPFTSRIKLSCTHNTHTPNILQYVTYCSQKHCPMRTHTVTY